MSERVRSGGTPAVAVGLALVCAAALRPHLFALSLWPESRDAALWIVRGAPGQAGWLEWVFGSKHFVGYRPLAALSYTLDYVAGGFAAWPYRVTDLALHLSCVLLVFALYRRLVPDLPRWGGVAAAAIFAAHPAVTEVVPHLARRSYSLATMLGLAALCVAAGRVPARPWKRSIVAGLLLAGALFANEVAWMTVPVLLVLTWTAGGLVGCVGPLVGAIAALLARAVVLGGTGGYETGADPVARIPAIVSATWRTLGALAPLDGVATPVAVAVAAAVVSAYYAWRMLAAGRLPHVLLVGWLVGYTLLFAPLGVWFPRQTYPMLAPLALALAIVLGDTLRDASAAWQSPRLALHLLPQAAAIAWLLAHSPVVRGADPARVAAWIRTDSLLRETHRDLVSLGEPGSVSLAVPYFGREEVFALRARETSGRPPLAADLPVQWLRGVLRGSGIEVVPLVAFEMDANESAAGCRIVDGPRGPAVALDRGRTHWVLAGDAVVESDGQTVLITVGPRTGGVHRLYAHDGVRGTLRDLPPEVAR